MIRVFIAEDQTMFYEGLKSLLHLDKEVELVGHAADGQSALDAILKLEPDVCLIDINMPVMDGISLCTKLKEQHIESKLIVLSTYTNREFVHNLLSLGINGYLIKNTNKDNLLAAIKQVQLGIPWYSDEVWTVVREIESDNRGMVDSFKNLSKRELEVLSLIGKGLSAPEIAEKLFLSAHTVDSHRKNLLTKLGFNSVAQLIKYAVDRGLTR